MVTMNCYLIYARTAEDDDEPLAAAVHTDADARSIDQIARSQHPGILVEWESVPLAATSRDPKPTVSLVLVGEADNPIGIGAYDLASEAQHDVDERMASGEAAYVRTVEWGAWLNPAIPVDLGNR